MKRNNHNPFKKISGIEVSNRRGSSILNSSSAQHSRGSTSSTENISTAPPKCRKKLQLSQGLTVDSRDFSSTPKENKKAVKRSVSYHPRVISSPPSQAYKKAKPNTVSHQKPKISKKEVEPLTPLLSLPDPNADLSILIEEDYPVEINKSFEEKATQKECSQFNAGDVDAIKSKSSFFDKSTLLEYAIPSSQDSTVSSCQPKIDQLHSCASKKDLYKLNRHCILECDRSDETQQIRLVVKPVFGSSLKRTCMLRDSWLSTQVAVGDIVNIHATWYQLYDENDEEVELAIIDSVNGFIVLRPDLLVASRSLLSSLICRRKSVLSERFANNEPPNRAKLSGTLAHRLVQKSFKEKRTDLDSMNRIVLDLLNDPSTLQKLHDASLAPDDLKKDLEGFIPNIRGFAERYFEGNIAEKKTLSEDGMWNGTVESILDIEDNWWSPRLGLKGKVDVTVKIHGRQTPLELKTGRPNFSAEDKGQVTIYSMIMNDEDIHLKSKPDSDDLGGLLFYLSEGQTKRIPAKIQELQGLVQLRNEMVCYLAAPAASATQDGELRATQLPEGTDRIAVCSSCPHRTACTIYKISENDSTVSEAQRSFASHLSAADRNYFTDWSLMLQLEQSENQSRLRPLSDIWCLSPEEREEEGRCFAHLKIQDCRSSQQNLSELSQFIITLVPKPKLNESLEESKSLLPKTNMKPGDNVALSTADRVALVTGSVIKIGPSSITIATERDISNTISEEVFLDKLDYQKEQKTLYSNLSRLMDANPHSTRLRRLIIDLHPPRFIHGFTNSATELILSEPGRAIMKPLNPLQQRAVLKALCSRDFCLIEGLPGTGKTSLIVALILLADLCGLSVLLTSYTHSAVDNVLLKLLQAGFKDFLRLGRSHRIHQDVLPFSAEMKISECQNIADIHRLYNVPVMAATCLSIGDPLIANRSKLFDLCIVDEAAQALQVAVIGPLLAAKRFVLVGDPRQLPPVVQSQKAKEKGMNVSLFQRLVSSAPDHVIRLRQQYRMSGPLNALANRLTYGGDLICANHEVELAALPIKETQHPCPSWLATVVRGGLDHSLVFLDTSLLPVQGQKKKDRFGCPVNILEANIAMRIVSYFNRIGVECSQMGIIAPYQSQVQHLQNLARESMPGLEVNTVDQYQGRDKSVIIYTCTKIDSFRNLEKDKDQPEGSPTRTILHDMRRLTVAVTRAKHKLIIIGHGSTLHQYAPFAQLMDNLESEQRVIPRFGQDDFDLKF